MLQGLFDSLFIPGINGTVLGVLIFGFTGLIFLLSLILILDQFNIHVFCLLTLSILLFAAILWFIHTFDLMQKKNEQVSSIDTTRSKNKKKKKSKH